MTCMILLTGMSQEDCVTDEGASAMKVAIIGSRDFPDLQMVRDFVGMLDQSVDIISGGARGVDATAVEEAKKRKMRWKEFRPNDPSRRSDYHERNSLIVESCDALVAF